MIELGFLGGSELVLIALAAMLLFFGGKKLPELAKGLGRAMGEFKKGRMEFENEIRKNMPAIDTDLGLGADLENTAPKKTNMPVAKTVPSDSGEVKESKVVLASRALGIETEGKSEEELKKELATIAGGPGP